MIKRAAEISGLTAEQVRTAGKEPWRVEARSLGCYWAMRELGLTTVAVSEVSDICPTAVSKAVCRREWYAQGGEIGLKEKVTNSAPSLIWVQLLWARQENRGHIPSMGK